MSTTAHLLALAQQHYQTRSFAQVEQLCGRILAADPANIDTWCLLAAACVRQEKYDQAIAHYQESLRLNPRIFAAHYMLGIALHDKRRLEQAEQHFRSALSLAPDHADTHHRLGLTLRTLGRLEEAIACFRQALHWSPNLGDAWYNLGAALSQQDKLDEAIDCFQLTIQLQPDCGPAYLQAGIARERQNKFEAASQCYLQASQRDSHGVEALVRLATLLNTQGNSLAAGHYFEQALRLAPEDAQLWNHLGVVRQKQGNGEEAVRCGQEAVRLDPGFSQAHFNLGVAFGKQGKHEQAIRCYMQALEGEPDFVDAQHNLGSSLVNVGRMAEAEAAYRKALQLRPEDGDAHWNLAHTCLRLGRFDEGWREYEWRSTQPGFAKRVFSQPLWDGTELGGRTILLYGEQGLGDVVQFIRYVSLVKQRGGRVMVLSPPRWERLLASVKGIDELVAEGGPVPPFDVYAPLLSLPRILGTTLASIPADIPYLFADPVLQARWHVRLGQRGTFKIGIAWQGNPTFSDDAARSIALHHFARLAKVKGVQLVSLQKGHGREQLQATAGAFAVTDLGEQLDETTGTLMDTAAVMKNLDLVISSDTSIPHLAGALGVPVWVALAKIPDWRWLLEREDCPWYPTMRLFRQRRAGDWSEVFERMAAELEARLLNLSKCNTSC